MSKEVDISKMVIVNIAGYDYALDVELAFALIKSMVSAEHIESEYTSGSGYKYYKSDQKPNISLKLMGESQYLEAMINGYRPKKQPEF